jgi:hypothetical protein
MSGPHIGEREANARLIAKAPEMYELLEKVIFLHGPIDPIAREASRIKAAIDGEG